MSHNAPSSHGHPASPATHGADGDVAHPHIGSIKSYLIVWGALMVLTVVTVVAATPEIQPYLGVMSVPLALLIATVKATLVALFFMHLYYDERFNAVVFASGLFFLMIFFGLTLMDPLTRGFVDREEYADLGSHMDRPKSSIHDQMAAAAAAATSHTLATTKPTSGTAAKAPAPAGGK